MFYRIGTSAVTIASRERKAASKVLRTPQLCQGERVEAFENNVARYCNVRHCIAVNSGSSANLVALSLLAGRNTEVITTPVSFATSVMPILQLGAIPVFADVDPSSYCMTPEGIRRSISRKTSAILVVHLLGYPCDMKPIMELAEARGLPVIEDACEALGAEAYAKKVGGYGTIGTFSFHPAHHVTTGEGGMCLTNDSKLAEGARSLRDYGRSLVAHDGKNRWRKISKRMGVYDIRHSFLRLGYNFKMTEMQAAIGSIQLDRSAEFLRRRRANAHFLNMLLSHTTDSLQLPAEPAYGVHAFHAYPLMVRRGGKTTRLRLVRYLEKRRIETRPIEGGNLARQPFMKNLRYRIVGPLRISDHVHRNGFFVGCHETLRRDDLEYLAANIADCIGVRSQAG